MKKSFSSILIALFFAISAFECGGEKDCCVLPPCSESTTLKGTWRLQSYENQTTGKEDPDPDPSGKGVVYTFTDDEKTGSIEGHTFVNTVSGKYELGSNCSFRVLGFGGSKVGEPGWSGKAWLTSDKSGYYQIAGDRLVIYLDGTPERMLFKKL